MTAPHAKMSVRWSAFRPSSCSGARYCSVPTRVPGLTIGVVRVTVSDQPGDSGAARCSARPKSRTLIPSLRHHDVARLQIAVEEPLAVRPVEGIGELHGEHDGLVERQRSAGQPGREVLALDEFHHQIAFRALGCGVARVDVADVVERADMRMSQLGGGARLPFEPLAEDADPAPVVATAP